MSNLNLLYKYRGGNEDIFERDVNSIVNNTFWAPNYIDLNDPCEAMVYDNKITKEINFISKLFRIKTESKDSFLQSVNNFENVKSKIGIYSLSTSYTHELLWAHYANSHKGFCIEFDLNYLLHNNPYHKSHLISVKYSTKPPYFSIRDIKNMKNKLIEKLAGTKSKSWSYEKEIRIITDSIGENQYEFEAVKAIYFGLRMSEKHKIILMEKLKGRSIEYFQMKIIDQSYNLIAEPIQDLCKNAIPYLYKIKQGNDLLSYEIKEKRYYPYAKKGKLKIILENKLTFENLRILSIDLKNKIFNKADRIYISYSLINQIDPNIYWANANFILNEEDIKICGMTIDEEKRFKNQIDGNTNLNTIVWFDDSPYCCSKLTLFKSGIDYVMETHFVDDTKMNSKLKVTNTKDGTMFENIDNQHSEYFIVNKDGLLKYYSKDGLFLTLKPYYKNLSLDF